MQEPKELDECDWVTLQPIWKLLSVVYQGAKRKYFNVKQTPSGTNESENVTITEKIMIKP